MEKPTVSVLSSTSNAPVVQLSTRAFPGFVLQGDSLYNLVLVDVRE
jgi:hypothetical protein